MESCRAETGRETREKREKRRQIRRRILEERQIGYGDEKRRDETNCVPDLRERDAIAIAMAMALSTSHTRIHMHIQYCIWSAGDVTIQIKECWRT